MTVATLPQLGDILENGATVLAYKSLDDGHGIVLAYTGADYYEPYVTWSYRESDGVTTSGHYFRRILNAAQDFEQRS